MINYIQVMDAYNSYLSGVVALANLRRYVDSFGVRLGEAGVVNAVKDKRVVKELLGMNFVIQQPSLPDIISTLKETEGQGKDKDDISKVLAFLEAEFAERWELTLNPGEAYLEEEEKWKPFLNKKGEFSYTYGERLNGEVEQLAGLIDRLSEPSNHKSRHFYLSVWDRAKDFQNIAEGDRVPCTIGYNIRIQNKVLVVHHLMRSLDVDNWPRDYYLTYHLAKGLKECAELKEMSIQLIFTAGSLHRFYEV